MLSWQKNGKTERGGGGRGVRHISRGGKGSKKTERLWRKKERGKENEKR